MTPHKNLRNLLIGGLIFSNILVFALFGYSLYHSRQHYDQGAEVQTQNIANTLDQSVSASIGKIDLALRTVTDELERNRENKGLDELAMNAFLTRLEQRLPEVENLRVADASGFIILGRGITRASRVSVADRDYFIYHRDNVGGALQISKPMVGRVVKKPLIPFVRRYNHADGSFAGVVYATVAVDQFTKLLSQVDVGPSGSIILRDADLGLIARVPAIFDNPAGKLGNRLVSPELRERVDSGVPSATFLNSVGGDGIHRMISFRRLEKAPMIVIVGVAGEDYLAGWRTEEYRAAASALGFLMISLLFANLLRSSLAQTQKLANIREESLNRLQKIASRVPGVVYEYRLHSDGSSCFPFASEGIREIYRVSPEEVRDDATKVFATLHPDDSAAVSESIQTSARDLTPWHHEYRVKFDDGTVRWLLGRAVPDTESDGSVLWRGFITDITERRQSEETLRKLSSAVEQSPASVVITDLDACIQYVNPRFSEVTGYDADEAVGQNPRILQSGQTSKGTYLELWENLAKGLPWKGELLNRRKNGELYWEEASIAPVKGADSANAYFVAVKTDITERKKAEVEL